MTDNELIRAFWPILKDGLIAAGYTDVVSKQANQPTQQGTNTPPTVYFYKVGDKRYGFLRRDNVWNTVDGIMEHIEEQWYETTFQMSALVIQNPSNPEYTASDLVNETAAIMQSDKTREQLLIKGIGILRVTEVRNPYFTDDRDRFEASPSFDFVLTHKQTRVTTDPVIESFEFNIKRV